MVLVTGANGTIGSQVTRQLATTGCLVRAMVRKLVNAETLPKTDVEVVVLLHDFYDDLGLGGLELKISSLGDGVCRPGYL